MKLTQQKKSILLWIASGLFMLALLVTRFVFPEILGLTIALGVLSIASLGFLLYENRKALRGRTMAFGLNSATTTVLVISIVGVLNFIAYRYPLKKDLTANKLHSLSEQTEKIFKELKAPIQATVYVTLAEREEARILFENLRTLTTQLQVEYVDPQKELARARGAGVRTTKTIVLSGNGREQRIEDLSEEKITNATIKLLKDRGPTLCALIGHGEKNFSNSAPDGADGIKRALGAQAYELREINLPLETNPDTLSSCEAVIVFGPTKDYFANEVEQLKSYLDKGGRALFALDFNLKGAEFAPSLVSLMNSWGVDYANGIIVDPFSRLHGADVTIPLAGSYSKQSAIVKDFDIASLFPITRSMSSTANTPAGLKIQWLAQSTQNSWLETSVATLAAGKGQISKDPGQDISGPLNLALSVEGKKDEKAARSTRIVALGTSTLGINAFIQQGGNLDFIMNSLSWLVGDEDLIAVRKKEDEAGRVNLSQRMGNFISLLTVLLIPLLVAASGIGIWFYRKRL